MNIEEMMQLKPFKYFSIFRF